MIHLKRNFSKTLTEVEILTFFTDIEIMRKFWPKSRFSKLLTEIEIFWKFWLNSSFFEIFPGNRNFPKKETEMEILKLFDRNRIFFKLRSKSYEDFVQIKYFVGNRDFQNHWPESIFFRKRRPKSRFSKFLTEIESFRKFWTKSRFLKLMTKIEIFGKFWTK